MMDRASGRLIGSPANNADRAALSAFVKSEDWTCAWYDRVNLARLMPICFRCDIALSGVLRINRPMSGQRPPKRPDTEALVTLIR